MVLRRSFNTTTQKSQKILTSQASAEQKLNNERFLGTITIRPEVFNRGGFSVPILEGFALQVIPSPATSIPDYEPNTFYYRVRVDNLTDDLLVALKVVPIFRANTANESPELNTFVNFVYVWEKSENQYYLNFHASIRTDLIETDVQVRMDLSLYFLSSFNYMKSE